MPIVDVEGQRFQFPDGTSDEIIGQAIRDHFSQQAAPQQPVEQPKIQGAEDVTTGTVGDIPANIPVAPSQPALALERFGGGAVRPEAAGFGIAEPIATLITGAIAEPIAGIAGLAAAPFIGSEAGDVVEGVREALTFRPRTEEGQRGLQAIGDALKPVAETLESAEKFLGDSTFDATNSPALAAAATTIPTALLEVLGVASTKGAIKTVGAIKRAREQIQIRRAVVEAAPDIDQLKAVSREVYKELDASGVSLQPKAFNGLVNRVNNAAKKSGFDPDLTPKSAAVLRRFESELGSSPSLTDVDNLRKVAGNAAKSLEPADSAIGSIIVENIDQFLDLASPTAFKRGSLSPSEIAPKYRVARELWGRARRSELINDAFERAKNQASGFENGLVTNFRSILNNKKKARFFKKNELDAMRLVVRGTTKENVAKLIGRLGFSEGHATNLIGGSLGIAAGAQIAGPVGAVAVPVIGQVSRKLAQRLTRGNAEFADVVVRAGSNADEIAKAYIKNTPAKLRSSSELSELLSRPDVALESLALSKSKLFSDASDIARGNQIITTVSAAPGSIQASQQNKGQQ